MGQSFSVSRFIFETLNCAFWGCGLLTDMRPSKLLLDNVLPWHAMMTVELLCPPSYPFL